MQALILKKNTTRMFLRLKFNFAKDVILLRVLKIHMSHSK